MPVLTFFFGVLGSPTKVAQTEKQMTVPTDFSLSNLEDLLWMDKILHHFESLGNHCLLVFTGNQKGFSGGAKWMLQPSTVGKNLVPSPNGPGRSPGRAPRSTARRRHRTRSTRSTGLFYVFFSSFCLFVFLSFFCKNSGLEEGGMSSIHERLLFAFPLVLQGIYHCWTYLCPHFFLGGGVLEVSSRVNAAMVCQPAFKSRELAAIAGVL